MTWVSAVPYGALAHMSSCLWDPETGRGLCESVQIDSPSVSHAQRRRIQEASDLLGLPYHSLTPMADRRVWPQSVKEEVLRAVVELRFYKLCMPLRERYLDFVEALLGTPQRDPQMVERTEHHRWNAGARRSKAKKPKLKKSNRSKDACKEEAARPKTPERGRRTFA